MRRMVALCIILDNDSSIQRSIMNEGALQRHNYAKQWNNDYSTAEYWACLFDSRLLKDHEIRLKALLL